MIMRLSSVLSLVLIIFGLSACSMVDKNQSAGLPSDQKTSFIHGISVSLVEEVPVGMNGYDPVHFQRSGGQMVVGAAENSVVHDDVHYWFVSAGNAAAFASDPEQYLPQFGGMCAWGVVDNPDTHPSLAVNLPHTTPSSPGVYALMKDEDGQPVTLGFYNEAVRDRFMADPVTALKAAEEGYAAMGDRIIPWSAVRADVQKLREGR